MSSCLCTDSTTIKVTRTAIALVFVVNGNECDAYAKKLPTPPVNNYYYYCVLDYCGL